MRILVVNSNTTPAVTDRIEAAARAAASPGVEIEAVTAPFGLPLIVSRADWLVAGQATLAALAERRGQYDAAVIACFGDPGLDAAKELLDVPVLGISEAAFHAACMLGRRFGVVSFTTALRPMFEDCLAHHGLTARCTGFRMGPPFTGDPGRVAEERAELLVSLCEEAIEQDGAEVLILAGGPLAGLAPVLAPRVAVPLVDGTTAAVRLAEAMVGLAPPGRPRRVRARSLTGFGEELARLYGG
ncbi:aspartate/glutamate racemase family protein [Falsiroseomonas oryziterrae]|uniref:aspartate/glutamate racemase family protein n=1 Tax=Falsiroseomonas oryziterrae TaxID=2911368 RepID=UPI001F3D47D2|nr:aspartate/glutamate racemase family protein [Roseomonas sp. NPKOSM-4]